MTEARESAAREVLADVLGYREGSAQRASFLDGNMIPIVFPSDAVAAALKFADREREACAMEAVRWAEHFAGSDTGAGAQMEKVCDHIAAAIRNTDFTKGDEG